MDSWGDRMPLPDANKRSPRVYTNLQNLDLSTVTFSNIETTGDPIAIEEANEDELRRLVLVNLARLVCAGEWNGLLTAGGGDAGYGVLRPLTTVGTYDGFEVCSMAPWGVANGDYGATAAAGYPQAYPFVSPQTGDVASIEIYCSTASASSTVKIAIYAQDADTHMPSTMLGYVDLDTSSTGTISETSFTGGTPSLTAGTQYWICQARGTSAYGTMRGCSEDARLGVGLASDPTNGPNCQAQFAVDWAATDPVDTVGTLNAYVSGNSMRVLLKW